jgi:hypothetical protein
MCDGIPCQLKNVKECMFVGSSSLGDKKKSDDGGCGSWYVEHLKSSEHGLFSASVAE